MIAIKFILHSRDITFILYEKKKGNVIIIIIKLLISFIGFVNEISGLVFSRDVRFVNINNHINQLYRIIKKYIQ